MQESNLFGIFRIDSVPAFKNVTIPMIALAGKKEQKEVHESIRRLSEQNPNCKYEIWDKAGHNIPPLCAGKLNALICSMMEK